jgi:hypothetical protein
VIEIAGQKEESHMNRDASEPTQHLRKRFFDYEWSGFILAGAMGLAGLILILVSQLLLAKMPQLWSWFFSFLQDAGLALLIAGTASALVERLIKKRADAELEKKMCELLDKTASSLSGEVFSFLQRYMGDLLSRVEMVKGAIHKSNIETIFAKRQDGFHSMANAICEAKEHIYIMGVSLREFSQLPTDLCRALKDVHLRTSRNRRAGDASPAEHAPVCGDGTQLSGTSSNVTSTPVKPIIKMLVLNNQSSEALRRSRIEEKKEFTGQSDPEYITSNLFRDTRNTIREITENCKEIDLKVYDNLSLFLLITERYVFMEPYHSGVRNAKPFGDDLFFQRAAELVPMIQFRKGTDGEPGPYEQFYNHFVHVFDEQAHTPTEKNTDIECLGQNGSPAPSHGSKG